MAKNRSSERIQSDSDSESEQDETNVPREGIGRRKLIATLGGAGTLSVAGCLGLLDEENSRPTADLTTVPEEETTTPKGTEEGEGTTERETEETTTEETTTTVDVETFEVTWVNEGDTTISVPGSPRTSDGAVPGNDSLLDNALDEGLNPPWQCGRGICGYCASKVDGNGNDYVEHGKGQYSNQYLNEEQIEAGYVLTCVGWPKQDFAIETDKRSEADEVGDN